jgi:hypothetical protein
MLQFVNRFFVDFLESARKIFLFLLLSPKTQKPALFRAGLPVSG